MTPETRKKKENKEFKRRLEEKALKKLIENKYKIKNGHIIPPKKNYSVLSASRSNFTGRINASRTNRLKKELQAEGYKPISAIGVFKENIAAKPMKERSFLVPNMTLHEAEYHGREFGQEAVLENNLEDFIDRRKPEEIFEGRIKFDGQANRQTFKTIVKGGRHEVIYSLQDPIIKVKR